MANENLPVVLSKFMEYISSTNLDTEPTNFDQHYFIAHVIESIQNTAIILREKKISSNEKDEKNLTKTKYELVSTPKLTSTNKTFSTPFNSQNHQRKSLSVNQYKKKNKKYSNKNRSMDISQDQFENSRQFSPNHRKSQKARLPFKSTSELPQIKQRTIFDISSSTDFPVLDSSVSTAIPVIKPILNSTLNKASRRITPTMVVSTNTKEICRLFGDTDNLNKNAEVQKVSNAMSLKKERELLLKTRIFSDEKIETVKDKNVDGMENELKNISPIKSSEEIPQIVCNYVLSDDDIEKLQKFSKIYTQWILKCLVPSIVTEIHTLLLLLNLNGDIQNEKDNRKDCDFEKLLSNSIKSKYFANYSLDILVSSNYLSILNDDALHSIQKILQDKSDHHTLYEKVTLEITKRSEKSTSFTYGNSSIKNKNLNSIPYQEETDGQTNFISESAFRSFRKQRDTFYAIIRDWNNKHHEGDFSKDFIGKLRWLVNQIRVHSTFDQFIRLFLDHLLFVGVQKGNLVKQETKQSPHIIASSFPGDLDRILKLENRVSKPNQSSGGRCWFSNKCKFFKDFIYHADSYSFNVHLCDYLKKRIMEFETLNCEIETQSKYDIREGYDNILEAITSLRICGNLYGYTVSLPHKEHQGSTERNMSHIEASAAEFVTNSLKNASKNGHLLITVPWIVQFLSQTSSSFISHHTFADSLHNLGSIYRSTTFNYLTCNPSMFNFYLTISIGSLFELQIINSNVLYEILGTVATPTFNINHDSVDNVAEQIITRKLLYQMNDKLSEITTLLKSNCMVVNRPQQPKKIKPSTQKLPQALNLQENLEMIFFRNQPLSLKNAVTFISQRCQSNCIKLICSKLLNECFTTHDKVLLFLSKLKAETKMMNPEIKEAAKAIYPDVLSHIKENILIYNHNHVNEAMKIVLFSGTTASVLDLACSICERMSLENINCWLNDRLFDHVEAKVKYYANTKTTAAESPVRNLSMFLHSLRMSVITCQKMKDDVDIKEHAAKSLNDICEYFPDPEHDFKTETTQAKNAIILLTKELIYIESKGISREFEPIKCLNEEKNHILGTILKSAS